MRLVSFRKLKDTSGFLLFSGGCKKIRVAKNGLKKSGIFLYLYLTLPVPNEGEKMNWISESCLK